MNQSIKANYAERIICPSNAIDLKLGLECQTGDGVNCKIQVQAVWNNEDGGYDEELDYLCKKYFDVPFKAIRSIWFSRLGGVSDYWYNITLIKL